MWVSPQFNRVAKFLGGGGALGQNFVGMRVHGFPKSIPNLEYLCFKQDTLK